MMERNPVIGSAGSASVVPGSTSAGTVKVEAVATSAAERPRPRWEPSLDGATCDAGGEAFERAPGRRRRVRAAASGMVAARGPGGGGASSVQLNAYGAVFRFEPAAWAPTWDPFSDEARLSVHRL